MKKLKNADGSPYTYEDFKYYLGFFVAHIHLKDGKKLMRAYGIDLKNSELLALVLLSISGLSNDIVEDMIQSFEEEDWGINNDDAFYNFSLDYYGNYLKHILEFEFVN